MLFVEFQPKKSLSECMSVTLQKALNILSKSGAFRRIILAWNKTPLRYLSKTAAVIAHFGQFKRRYAMIKNYTLSESEEKIVRQLHSDGYADLSSHINLDLLNQLHDYSHEKLNRVESIHQQAKNKNKDFWVRLSDEDIGDQVLSAANPMVQFAIQENILKIIGKYIGQTAFLEYVLLTLSLPSEGDFKSSQLWHFDRDETKMLKLFVYLTDVKETASGPFTFIDKKNSQKVKNSFIMRHLHDADIFKYVSTSDQIQMIKPKLSCFVVDTSKCYHMGSRLQKEHKRLLYTALYIGLPSVYPWGGQEKYTLVNSSLTPLQTMALINQ